MFSVTFKLFNRKIILLGFCIMMDAIGMLSLLLPFIGGIFDFFWAPISPLIYWLLFGTGKKAIIGGWFVFLEQILPSFDIIPLFTITYFLRKRQQSKAKVIY